MNMPLVLLNRRRRGGAAAFTPAGLFALSEPGVWYDPSDVANLAWRRNLLTFTEQFDNAAWVKAGLQAFGSGSTANATTAPDGTLTADFICENTASGLHRTNSLGVSYVAGTSLTATVRVKSTTRNYSPYLGNASGALTATFNLSNGTISVAASNIGTASGATASITQDAQGFWLCTLSGVVSASSSTDAIIYHQIVNGTSASYTGDGTSGIFLWGAQLELGSVATDYQRISDVNTEVIERFPSATLYQDTAGTTPVTTPGQTVALALDKSKGAVGTNGGGRINLLLNTESLGGGTGGAPLGDWINFNTTNTSNAIVAPNGTTTANRMLETTTNGFHSVYVDGGNSCVASAHTASFAVKGGLGRDWCWVNVYNADNATADAAKVYFNVNDGSIGTVGAGATASRTDLGNGWWRFSVTRTVSAGTQATASALYATIGPASADGVASYAGDITKGIYVWGADLRLAYQVITPPTYQRITSDWPSTIAGFHATQATLASRPTYGIVPLGGRRNLLTRTEEFENAAWLTFGGGTKTGTNVAVAPNGTTTADSIRVTTADTGSNIYQEFTAAQTSSNTYTFSVWVRRNAATDQTFQLFQNIRGVTPFGRSGNLTATDTWQRFTLTHTSSGGTGASVFGIIGNTSGTQADLLVWGAQLETGSSATAYQRVGSAFDVTEAGVASLSYLSFDGVDDWLVTPTITPGIDKAQVFAGVRKLSDAASSLLVETSTTSTSTANTIGLLNSITTGGQNRFNSAGSIRADAFATIAAPATFVYTGLSDVSAPSVDLRINSVSGGAITASQGTVGNYAAHPIYIGRRAGTSAPFNGQLYSLLVRFGTNLDAGTITSTETWVNQRTGAF